VNNDQRLGTLALRYNMVTPQQLQVALALQAQEVAMGKLPRQLGLIFLAGGMITEVQLDTLLGHQQTFRQTV
jgi:hypothetical protein